MLQWPRKFLILPQMNTFVKKLTNCHFNIFGKIDVLSIKLIYNSSVNRLSNNHNTTKTYNFWNSETLHVAILRNSGTLFQMWSAMILPEPNYSRLGCFCRSPFNLKLMISCVFEVLRVQMAWKVFNFKFFGIDLHIFHQNSNECSMGHNENGFRLWTLINAIEKILKEKNKCSTLIFTNIILITMFFQSCIFKFTFRNACNRSKTSSRSSVPSI